MDIVAKTRYLRGAPRKLRLVTDLIRGMDVGEAETQLDFIPKAAGRHLKKLLASAVANAETNFHVDKSGLFIRKISVDGGPILWRYRPRAFGRAYPIAKRTSHIMMILDMRASAPQKHDRRTPETKTKTKAPIEGVRRKRRQGVPERRRRPVTASREPAGSRKGISYRSMRQFFRRKSI